jgi:hypothetical protein
VPIVGADITAFQRGKRINPSCSLSKWIGSHCISNEGKNMVNPQYAFSHISNNLLFNLSEQDFEKPLNYGIVSQNAEAVQDIQNVPAISMEQHLIESGQAQLLTAISIYSQCGECQNQVRLLYMNYVAFRIWKAMGKRPNLIGAQHRPPKTALLTLGVPFSE